MVDNYLVHYGILGQKWGVRRFENADGTLTEAGKKRYGTKENYEAKKTKRDKTYKDIATAASVGAGALGAAAAVASSVKAFKSDGDDTSSKLFSPGSKNDKPSSAERAASSAKEGIKSAQDLNKKITDMANSKEVGDLSKYTDAELRQMVNRFQLEEQYADYVKKHSVTEGQKAARDALDVIGSVAGISASIVGIAAAIYKMKH